MLQIRLIVPRVLTFGLATRGLNTTYFHDDWTKDKGSLEGSGSERATLEGGGGWRGDPWLRSLHTPY